jgi:hypothetical protein
MRFLRWLFPRAHADQAVECARQFPYGIDAEAYGGGWNSPASQAERRAHRSQGWTAQEFRAALEGGFGNEVTRIEPLVFALPANDGMADFDTLEMPALWTFDAIEPAARPAQ